MKKLITLALLSLSTSLFAQNIVQAITMKGAPDTIAMAQVVTGDEVDSAKLVITENGVVEVENSHLYLPDMQYPLDSGVQILSTNAAGSLKVTTTNEHLGIGRYVYTTVLTIAYRAQAYRLIGFTHTSYDKLNPQAAQSCDYNLATGQGIKNGRRINLRRNMPELQILKDEHVVDCNSFRRI